MDERAQEEQLEGKGLLAPCSPGRCGFTRVESFTCGVRRGRQRRRSGFSSRRRRQEAEAVGEMEALIIFCLLPSGVTRVGL